MSKKDRVKANAKPAKSDAAASLLGTSQAFIGFDTQDSFVLAPEIHAHLKKLNKKDSNTKIKSLQDLTEIIPSNDNLTWVNLIPQWCRFYPKLCTDEDTMVRKNSHLFHTLIVTRTKKDFTPYLKQVAGYWLLSMFDPYPSAAREAKTSFFSTFPDDKWIRVLLFCKTEIFELLLELLNTEMSSLDDDPDRASLKYYRLTSQSLALAVFLLQSDASGYRESMRSDIIPNLFQKPKLMKLIELPDTSVQKNYVALLNELVMEDLVDVFDVEEVQTGINLKPLENVALNEMDEKIVEDLWKIILKLEKSKMFCRAPKHQKQWLNKINEIVQSKFEHLSFVSNYVISSTVLEPKIKSEWFSSLSNELTLTLQDKASRIPVLNEYLQSVFFWLGTDQEDDVIAMVLTLFHQMCQNSNHVLFACEFCALTHNYCIKNEKFCIKVVQFLSDCFQELDSQSESYVICLDRLLKLEKTLKRVRIEPSLHSSQKCEQLIEVYSRNVTIVECLISQSFAALDLCASIYSEIIAKEDSEYHFSSDQFVKMIGKCSQDPNNLPRCESICKLACLSGFSLVQYEEIFKHITDPKIVTLLVTAELQLNKVSLLESDLLLTLISQKCHESALKIVYENLDKMQSERISAYVAALQHVEGDGFFDLSEILLKKLTYSETELRKRIYSSVLKRSSDALDTKLLSLTDNYLSCQTDTEDLKEFFLFFANLNSEHNLTNLQIRCLCRKLFEAAEKSERRELSQFFVKTLLEMLVQKATSSEKLLKFLFEFNGLLLPDYKFRSHSVNKLSPDDIDQFIDFVKDIHQLSLTVTEKEEPTIAKWLSDIRLLSRVLVPLKDENDITDINQNPVILLVAETEVFKLIASNSSLSSGDTCDQQLIDSENLSEKDLNSLFGKVTMQQITQYFYQIIGKNTISPIMYANMMRVLLQVEEYLCDGFDLVYYETTTLLLNRQILYGMEWQLKRLNEGIGMGNLEELWDTFLCCLVCYGKNMSSTKTIFKNALYLSFGHVFMSCFSELISMTSNLDKGKFSTIIDEWEEVFRPDLEGSVCAYCVKLVKSDLPDRFFTKRFVEYSCLNSVKSEHLQKTLDSLRGDSNYLSYISPGLLSRNYKVQTLAFNILQKCEEASEEFDLGSVKMLIEIAEMSSVGDQLMQSLVEQDGSGLEKIEVADPETHSSVSTFIRTNQLIFQHLGKEKASAVSELLQNELKHLNYELFLSILLSLIDYKFDYSKSFLKELSPKTAAKDANSLPYLAASCFLSVLIHTPFLCQNWFEKLDRRRRDLADQFVSKFLSPIIIKRAFDAINVDTSVDNTDHRLTIKTSLSERTVRAQYAIEDFAVDVKLSYAKNYPLGRISIEEIKKKKIGVKDEEWQRLLLDLKISLEQETVSLVSGIIHWKKTLEQIFEGVEECCVCMAVVHPSNRSLPSKPCKVCKKKFHGVCLFTWFEKGSANCPYCRSIF